MEKRPFYLTTAIAYASGKPHIGNTYEIILSDAIVRFKRMQGYDVRFQTGTDEHGQKIELKAQAEGITPKQYVDRVVSDIKKTFDLVNASYDKFIRTTDEDHERQVQKLFKKFYDKGDIYKGSYEGLYCTPCESFWTSSQLVDGKCPDCGREVQPVQEEAYFFNMKKYVPELMEYMDTHPDFVIPESRKNEMVNNFLKKGLQDLCVSRTTFKWGIPVDFDPKHVVYVWLDALVNYITGLGYDADGNHSELYKKYWPADVHVIGKDIVRFHTIYWPIFLLAMGEPLPKTVLGHPWLNQGEGKMSKSKGNTIYAEDLVKFFGVDATRYYVLQEMQLQDDGQISWAAVIDKTNSDLANTLGNLVNRTLAMSNKYFGGAVEDKGAYEEIDSDLFAVKAQAVEKCAKKMDEYKISDALGEIFTLFRRCNRYIDETAPWVLAKDESKKDRLATVLYNLSDCIVAGASLLYPFMPETCEKIAKSFSTTLLNFDELCENKKLPTVKVAENPEMLFARIDAKVVLKQVEEMFAARTPKTEEKKEPEQVKKEEKKEEKAATHESNAPSEISIDDFAKVRMQVGEVIACEKVAKSDKLLHSTVKVGEETRSIVSGIAKFYTPEEMVGKKVVLVTNLKPCKLRGVLSEGMILCAEDKDGNLSLISPEKSVISSGSGIF